MNTYGWDSYGFKEPDWEPEMSQADAAHERRMFKRQLRRAGVEWDRDLPNTAESLRDQIREIGLEPVEVCFPRSIECPTCVLPAGHSEPHEPATIPRVPHWTEQTTEEADKLYRSKPLSALRKHQEICVSQLKLAHEQGNERALIDLRQMEKALQKAILEKTEKSKPKNHVPDLSLFD